MEHVNAEILRAIADGKEVQYRERHSSSGWEFFDSSDGFLCWKLLKGSAIEWRIAPKKIMIGKHEVPEPCREAPRAGEIVWIINPLSNVASFCWNCTEPCYLALNDGFVHLTEEAARQHYEAIKNLLVK